MYAENLDDFTTIISCTTRDDTYIYLQLHNFFMNEKEVTWRFDITDFEGCLGRKKFVHEVYIPTKELSRTPVCVLWSENGVVVCQSLSPLYLNDNKQEPHTFRVHNGDTLSIKKNSWYLEVVIEADSCSEPDDIELLRLEDEDEEQQVDWSQTVPEWEKTVNEHTTDNAEPHLEDIIQFLETSESTPDWFTSTSFEYDGVTVDDFLNDMALWDITNGGDAPHELSDLNDTKESPTERHPSQCSILQRLPISIKSQQLSPSIENLAQEESKESTKSRKSSKNSLFTVAEANRVTNWYLSDKNPKGRNNRMRERTKKKLNITLTYNQLQRWVARRGILSNAASALNEKLTTTQRKLLQKITNENKTIPGREIYKKFKLLEPTCLLPRQSVLDFIKLLKHRTIHKWSLKEDKEVMKQFKQYHTDWHNFHILGLPTERIKTRCLQLLRKMFVVGIDKPFNKVLVDIVKDTGEDKLPLMKSHFIEKCKTKCNTSAISSDALEAVFPMLFERSIQNLQSKKVLFFYTHQKNVFIHFRQQIGKLIYGLGCPSWTEALVTFALSIDWNSIRVLFLCANKAAAMRLKLKSAKLFEKICFNERTEIFIPIEVGKDFYFDKLERHGIKIDELPETEKPRNIQTHPMPSHIVPTSAQQSQSLEMSEPTSKLSKQSEKSENGNGSTRQTRRSTRNQSQSPKPFTTTGPTIPKRKKIPKSDDLQLMKNAAAAYVAAIPQRQTRSTTREKSVVSVQQPQQKVTPYCESQIVTGQLKLPTNIPSGTRCMARGVWPMLSPISQKFYLHQLITQIQPTISLYAIGHVRDKILRLNSKELTKVMEDKALLSEKIGEVLNCYLAT